ncbi:WGR domain-containing protein [Bacillus cereus]|uniref:WGR domain-containing protein n=1 Tax=Bacillus cereus TaxID=1396 RepID=UPI000B4BEAEB|nr:WGR domain-containing protein [Bacillus cereus]
MVSKIHSPKELVYLDFNRGEFKFFNVEIISLGYNDIQVMFQSGKLGTKGKISVHRFNTGEQPFKNAMKFAYNKIFEKELQGFLSVEKVENGIRYAAKKESNKNKQNDNTSKNTNKKCGCSICKQPIHFKLYEKINSWGRGEGNWDFSSKSPLYQKVACLDCQIELGIFQKRIDQHTKF